MTSRLRRAAGFAAVGSLALAAPALGRATAVPFAAIAAAALVVDEGPLFELFARPADRRAGRLRGLAGFALAATALALLTTATRVRLPLSAFVVSVLVLSYGNLGRAIATRYDPDVIVATAGFAIAAFVAAVAGQIVVAAGTGAAVEVPLATFLAATAALFGALLRSILYDHDDPLVLLSIGLLLWLFDVIGVETTAAGIGGALAVTLVLGYVSYALGTASIPGMLTGVLLSLLTLVLGGLGWFTVLLSFFALGSFATKFRYEEKRERGIAQDNEGARGSGNVLGNSAIALLALLLFAGGDHLPVDPTLFRLAFVGSFAAAMSDTLSSEIGGLFDAPRLITTFEPVEPGTDGAVTVQGELAGIAGALLVAAIAYALLPLSLPGAGVVVVGGFVGMTADSVLGATLEGTYVGNQTVNFLATLTGALASVALGVML